MCHGVWYPDKPAVVATLDRATLCAMDIPRMAAPSDPHAARDPSRRWWPWFAVPLVLVLTADLLSKHLLFAAFAPGSEPCRWLALHYNPGVAWSMLSGMPAVVLGLTMVLIPILTWMWWSQYRHQGAMANLACGLVLGGALGNAWDRIQAFAGQLGGVRDFIHVDLGFPPFDPWPTFNLADSGICVGFILLVLHAWRAQRPA